MKPLSWPCKRHAWMSLLLITGLGINRWLLRHRWLSVEQSEKLQNRLVQQLWAEQKRLCRSHLQFIENCLATGSISSTPSNWEYLHDLQSLEAEGRYDSVLKQLYGLDGPITTDSEDELTDALD